MARLGDALGTGGPSSLHAPQLNTRTAGKHSGRKRFTLLHSSSSTPSTLLSQYVLSKRWILGFQTRTHQREPKTNHKAVTVISIAVTVTTIVSSQPPPLSSADYTKCCTSGKFHWTWRIIACRLLLFLCFQNIEMYVDCP